MPTSREGRAEAKLCVQATAHLPKGASFRFERPEDVPVDLAMSMAMNARVEFVNDSRNLLPVVIVLSTAARGTAEQLYLPADFMRAVRVPWEPEHTLRSLRAYRDCSRTRPLPRQGPPRQEPCPCGSGKKYKR